MGGLFNQTVPMICGGYDGTSFRSDCYSLTENIWTQVPTRIIVLIIDDGLGEVGLKCPFEIFVKATLPPPP